MKVSIPAEFRFEPVGKCIYCGRATPEVRRLTDEHFIPFSFGGHLLLPEASCDDCMEITGALCGRVCDLMLSPLRWHHGLPSRKKKNREKTIRVGISGKGELAHQPFQYEVAPGIVAFPVLELPGLLTGRPAGVPDIPIIGYQIAETVPDNVNRQKALQAQGLGRALAIAQLAPSDFMRILAQIGHGYQVSQQGYNPELPLADIVMGRDPDVSHYVGGTPAALNFMSESRPDCALHQIVPFSVSVEGEGYIAVQIRLFSYLTPPAPVYTVVISRWDIAQGDTYFSFTRNMITNQVEIEQLVMT